MYPGPSVPGGRADDADLITKPAKLLFRLLTFPVSFPFYLWMAKKRRREMTEFAALRIKNRIISDEDLRTVTLDWVKDHPDDYPFGEYDPKVPKLERTFRKMARR